MDVVEDTESTVIDASVPIDFSTPQPSRARSHGQGDGLGGQGQVDGTDTNVVDDSTLTSPDEKEAIKIMTTCIQQMSGVVERKRRRLPVCLHFIYSKN